MNICSTITNVEHDVQHAHHRMERSGLKSSSNRPLIRFQTLSKLPRWLERVVMRYCNLEILEVGKNLEKAENTLETMEAMWRLQSQ